MTNTEIIARITKNVDAIYEAGVYTATTQTRIRSIWADLAVLQAQVDECPLAGRCPLG